MAAASNTKLLGQASGSGGRTGGPQPAMLDNEIDDLLQALAARQVGEAEGPFAAHAGGVAFHDVEIDVHIRRKVTLVDDEEVGASDGRAAFPRDLLALTDRDHIERQVGKVRRKGGSKVVAAGVTATLVLLNVDEIARTNGSATVTADCVASITTSTPPKALP